MSPPGILLNKISNESHLAVHIFLVPFCSTITYIHQIPKLLCCSQFLLVSFKRLPVIYLISPISHTLNLYAIIWLEKLIVKQAIINFFIYPASVSLVSAQCTYHLLCTYLNLLSHVSHFISEKCRQEKSITDMLT